MEPPARDGAAPPPPPQHTWLFIKAKVNSKNYFIDGGADSNHLQKMSRSLPHAFGARGTAFLSGGGHLCRPGLKSLSSHVTPSVGPLGTLQKFRDGKRKVYEEGLMGKIDWDERGKRLKGGE